MCIQVPCVYLLSAASTVIRNSMVSAKFIFVKFSWLICQAGTLICAWKSRLFKMHHMEHHKRQTVHHNKYCILWCQDSLTEPRIGLLSEWTQPRMGLNPNGTEPQMRLNHKWDWSPYGLHSDVLNPKWTQPQMEWTQNGLNFEWTKLRMEWTRNGS